MEIETIINQKSEIINAKLNELINSWNDTTFYETAKYIIEAGGKRFRPVLTLLTCESVGGNYMDALNPALAIELIHTGSLLWDDIIDQDELRRGKVTVHKKWNINTAILAGAYFISKALELCVNHPLILEPMLKTISKLIEGEILDISTSIYNIENETRGQPLFESRVEADIFDGLKTRVKNRIFEGFKWKESSDLNAITKISEFTEEANYYKLIADKSASLIKLAAKTGAIIGGGSEEEINALGEYGLYLGLAFQIKDDLLGLISRPEVLGKPIGKDLQKGKFTLYLIHAFRNMEEEKIEDFLEMNKDAQNPEVFNNIKSILEDLGSIEYVEQKSKLLIERIDEILKNLTNSKYKGILKSFANYTIQRIK